MPEQRRVRVPDERRDGHAGREGAIAPRWCRRRRSTPRTLGERGRRDAEDSPSSSASQRQAVEVQQLGARRVRRVARERRAARQVPGAARCPRCRRTARRARARARPSVDVVEQPAGLAGREQRVDARGRSATGPAAPPARRADRSQNGGRAAALPAHARARAVARWRRSQASTDSRWLATATAATGRRRHPQAACDRCLDGAPQLARPSLSTQPGCGNATGTLHRGGLDHAALRRRRAGPSCSSCPGRWPG